MQMWLYVTAYHESQRSACVILKPSGPCAQPRTADTIVVGFGETEQELLEQCNQDHATIFCARREPVAMSVKQPCAFCAAVTYS